MINSDIYISLTPPTTRAPLAVLTRANISIYIIPSLKAYDHGHFKMSTNKVHQICFLDFGLGISDKFSRENGRSKYDTPLDRQSAVSPRLIKVL